MRPAESSLVLWPASASRVVCVQGGHNTQWLPSSSYPRQPPSLAKVPGDPCYNPDLCHLLRRDMRVKVVVISMLPVDGKSGKGHGCWPNTLQGFKCQHHGRKRQEIWSHRNIRTRIRRGSLIIGVSTLTDSVYPRLLTM